MFCFDFTKVFFVETYILHVNCLELRYKLVVASLLVDTITLIIRVYY